ncbi:Plasma membrane ATPase [Mucor velutinosus]|uniref:Plasma membrane ATPase n=1 Tax=Mucor velutinosus TaxID=708070 RepID=A0AAN7I098_9FUNG|nr:Plasma membrane ATPase [Mucor velutinosus]
MEYNKDCNNSEIKAHRNNLDQYYEYRIYDKNIGHSMYASSSFSEYAPCPIVIMSRHQGFQWNDELFVNAYRRSAGYECHKSVSLEIKDNKVMNNKADAQKQVHQEQSSEMPIDVIDIHLSEAECDVWP